MIAAFVAVTTGVKAQAAFGIQVGGVLANLEEKVTSPGQPDFEPDNTGNFGFLVGGVAEVPLTDMILFRPELNFIQKGAESDINQTETSGGFTTTVVAKGKRTLNFIELPLNFVYNANPEMGGFYFGLGPYVAYGISGDYEADVTTTVSGSGFPTQTQSGKVSADVKFDGRKDEDVAANDDNYHLNGFDVGASALVGYRLVNGLSLNLGYSKGFRNLDPNEGQKLKTNAFTFKIGYMLGANNRTTNSVKL